MSETEIPPPDRQRAPERRRGERHALDESARFKPNEWSSLEVRVTDISRTGFRARCEARLQLASLVCLEIPGVGPAKARIEWQQGDTLGASFFPPIDLARCSWVGLPHDEMGGAEASPLARLLVQRAVAKRFGRKLDEASLRREILSALPIVRPAG
jgi:hypothetical protein